MKKINNYTGMSRFDFYLDKLELLLTTAGKQKNPALWLYKNDARTPLFMLEALARVHTAIYKERRFIKLESQFKLLEDTLGAIDYYDVFAKEFIKDKNIPAAIINYMQAQTREKIQELNETLIQKKWIGENGTRIKKIKKKLSKTNWMKEEAAVKAIFKFYVDAVKHILDFVNKEDFHFENIETDVHELRRKLRWLSIYPQALLGSIQLSKVKKHPAYLNKYLTKETVSSPFNKMPDVGDNSYLFLLEQNYFYALSWIIAELGILKDSGLRIIVIKEALQETTTLNDTAAFKKTYQLTGKKQPSIAVLLKRSDAVCKTYFKEKNLEHLIIGVARVK